MKRVLDEPPPLDQLVILYQCIYFQHGKERLVRHDTRIAMRKMSRNEYWWVNQDDQWFSQSNPTTDIDRYWSEIP